jgi:tol-pal system protein YbgF
MRRLAAPATIATVLAALIAGGAILVPAAGAQVFGSQPYVPAPDPAVERLQSQVNAMEAELRKTTGKVEQLTFSLNEARRIANEANAAKMAHEKTIEDLSIRIGALERLAKGDVAELESVPRGPAAATADLSSKGPAAGPAAPAAPAAASASLPSDEAELLKTARNYLLQGDFPSAQLASNTFLARNPKSANASEAQYLLGEALLYQDNYSDAAAAYGKLLSDYPKAAKGPESLVKLARSMRLMGEKADACKALALMPKQFPKASDAAKTMAATEKSRAGC